MIDNRKKSIHCTVPRAGISPFTTRSSRRGKDAVSDPLRHPANAPTESPGALPTSPAGSAAQGDDDLMSQPSPRKPTSIPRAR